MSEERYVVEDRPSESRYVLIDRGEDTDRVGGGAGSGTAVGEGADGRVAAPKVIGEEEYVDLQRDAAMHRVFYHTRVSEEYGGQGLASVLVRAAVEHTVSTGRLVVPVCPYVVAWFKKHPEFAEHEVTAKPDHLQAVAERQQ